MGPSSRTPKLCMFCGGDESLGPMNKEHFVPRALWAGKRPPGTITLPAHISCNRAFSDDNDYFRTWLVSQEGTEHSEADKIRNGPVLRMARNRRRQYTRYIQDFAFRPRFTESGIFLGYQGSFAFEYQRIYRVMKNVVKGLFYFLQGRPLLSTTYIGVYDHPNDPHPQTESLVSKMSPWYGFGDTVFGWRHVFCENMEQMACLMCFYQSKLFYAITHDTRKEAKADESLTSGDPRGNSRALGAGLLTPPKPSTGVSH